MTPSAIRRPRASRTTREANREANSTSWVATSSAAPRRRRAPRSSSARSSLRPRSSPRVGSSRQIRPLGLPPAPRPAIAIASASRCRSPPERSRGSAPPGTSRPTAASAAAPAAPRQLLVDPLADEVVVGTLAEHARSPRRLRSTRSGLEDSGRRSQQRCSCRRRSGPSARPAPPGRRRGRCRARTSRRILPGTQLDPQAATAQRRRVIAPPPPRRRGRRRRPPSAEPAAPRAAPAPT